MKMSAEVISLGTTGILAVAIGIVALYFWMKA